MPEFFKQNYKRDRLDIFDAWRNSKGDWNKVQHLVERKAGKKTEVKGKRMLVKVRDLVAKGMPESTAIELRNKRKAENLTVVDDDFPDRLDELQFWHTVEVSASNINYTDENNRAEAKTELDADMMDDLLGENGLLANDMRVAIPGLADTNAQHAFGDAIANLTGVNMKNVKSEEEKAKEKEEKDRKKKEEEERKRKEKQEKVLTIPEIVQSALDGVKKELAEARVLELQLNAHQVCDKQAKFMTDHVANLTNLYKTLAELQAKGAHPKEYRAGPAFDLPNIWDNLCSTTTPVL